jgi:hypothetical protein
MGFTSGVVDCKKGNNPPYRHSNDVPRPRLLHGAVLHLQALHLMHRALWTNTDAHAWLDGPRDDATDKDSTDATYLV